VSRFKPHLYIRKYHAVSRSTSEHSNHGMFSVAHVKCSSVGIPAPCMPSPASPEYTGRDTFSMSARLVVGLMTEKAASGAAGGGTGGVGAGAGRGGVVRSHVVTLLPWKTFCPRQHSRASVRCKQSANTGPLVGDPRTAMTLACVHTDRRGNKWGTCEAGQRIDRRKCGTEGEKEKKKKVARRSPAWSGMKWLDRRPRVECRWSLARVLSREDPVCPACFTARYQLYYQLRQG
jgi:hypothetical protein